MISPIPYPPDPSTLAALPYRPCVGICLINKAGKIFAGQRLDQRSEAWQMPQGGIDAGERPIDAALRELGEETGLGRDKVEWLATTRDWHSYELPGELVPQIWGGRYRGQRQKYFAFRFLGEDKDIRIDGPNPEFMNWRWMEPDKLLESIVPFKRALYGKILEEFADLLLPA